MSAIASRRNLFGSVVTPDCTYRTRYLPYATNHEPRRPPSRPDEHLPIEANPVGIDREFNRLGPTVEPLYRADDRPMSAR